MRITLLGTGCPAVHSRRYGSAQLVEGGSAKVLVDCGNGCTQRLVEAGVSPAAPDALLVSHLHSDHLVDLWQLTVAGWHAGRQAPLKLFGPAPVLRHARLLMDAWALERAQRITHEARPNTAGFDLELVEIQARQQLTFEELVVTVVEVDHAPVAPAFGFVFEDGRRKLAFSGDTRPCPNLIAAATDADLLVHEVFAHGRMAPSASRSAATLEAVTRYHTLSSEVGRIAEAARARALLLTHLVPPDADPASLIAEAARDYAGPVIVGEDLMRLDLDSRTVHWRGMTAGLGTG